MTRHAIRLALPLCLGVVNLWAQDVSSIALDYSHCGYKNGLHPIPQPQARLLVPHVDGDVTARLQAAIDELAKRPLDENGFRGAVLLASGQYDVAGQLLIKESGIVLRGSSDTVIRATGLGRRPLIRVTGNADQVIERKSEKMIIGEGVAAGALQIPLDSTDGLSVGDAIVITRPSTKEWIDVLGMDRFLIGWRPGSRDIQWERKITAIDGNTIRVDAPITTGIEAHFGGGHLATYTWPGRTENIGIENLSLESVVSSTNSKDEDHAWVGITMANVRNAWVRQVTFRKFAGSAVMLWETARNVTVQDCLSLEPISEIGGHRRQSYFTMGQQTLFLRCWSEHGIGDFTVGHCAAGPNAFVACESHQSLGDSGPASSWASGVLYDNVKIDGAALRLDNRWVGNHSAGWAAANCVLWQCSAAEIHCFNPPTAKNFAFGVWGRYFGDGEFESVDEFADSDSLFAAQLAERSGSASKSLGPIGLEHFGATNPSYAQAEDFVNQSNQPQRTLRKVIEAAPQRDPIATSSEGVPVHAFAGEIDEQMPSNALQVVNGWLAVDGSLKIGKRHSVPWWRGNTRPNEAPKLGAAVTRFVPGRVGLGFTDDLDQVAQDMVAQGVATLDHNHGLWYDRRRDDHLRVRRSDGNVSAPFYEQPFARSGQGMAWDGLSLYDLEKPNPWYWSRLKAFADQADANGLVLYQQHYFQHTLLEAGAHWADSPWRSANNINQTEFPEPPPYMSDKRIFQAHLFYDVNHPQRSALHRQYIRQCLTNFADNDNVVHFIGKEYTGPLAFMQFWIDTVIEWEKETGKDALLAISCTKEVQDAILEDPARGKAISVIDIRYWYYTKEGKLYAPEGGKNLAPRQHARQLKPKSASSESVLRGVREYRERYPDKAVVSSNSNDGWAVLMGGGSLPSLTNLPADLLAAIPKMQPTELGLGNSEAGYLIDARESNQVLPEGDFTKHWIDRRTGELSVNPQPVCWLKPRK